MAIKDTSKKPYIIDNDSNIKVGIDLPFRAEGGFATTSTTIEAVKNNIRNLLQTNPGERLMQPNLGVELRSLLFEQIDESTLLSIQDTILDSLEFWLPFVEIQDIQILKDDRRTDINQIVVKILFNIKQNPNTTESVSINFSSDIGDTSDITTAAGY
tara:strand:- start:1282 stop:1752 length:471 start_codon:yes stop_codon:yes gene_type:complete